MTPPGATCCPDAGDAVLAVATETIGSLSIAVLLPVQTDGVPEHPPTGSTTPAGGVMVAVLMAFCANARGAASRMNSAIIFGD